MARREPDILDHDGFGSRLGAACAPISRQLLRGVADLNPMARHVRSPRRLTPSEYRTTVYTTRLRQKARLSVYGRSEMSLFQLARRGLLAAGTALGIVLCAHAPVDAQGAEPIKIGAVLSLTGPGAGIGQPERNGILLAEKTINAKGGIKGRPIKIIIEDDGSKPDIAKTKAERLIFEDKVVAMLGSSLTAATDVIGAITNSEQMTHVAFTGLGPKIELSYKSLYHVLPPQELNARAMMEYATKALEVRKVGVLHDTGYGQIVMNILDTLKGEYGVEFVAVEKFEVGATDASAQAAKVRAATPEIVFVIGTSATPFRNARQVKITQPIVSAIGASSYEYVKAMGEFADDIVYPEFVVGEDPLPHQKDFVKAYEAEYKSLPKNFEAAGWDAVQILAKGIDTAGIEADRQAVANAVRGPYAGVLARYDFAAPDMTGIGPSSYIFSKVVKGHFTRLSFTTK
jgi:branched-chain amino acid transport system substrate-binding protein